MTFEFVGGDAVLRREASRAGEEGRGDDTRKAQTDPGSGSRPRSRARAQNSKKGRRGPRHVTAPLGVGFLLPKARQPVIGTGEPSRHPARRIQPSVAAAATCDWTALPIVDTPADGTTRTERCPLRSPCFLHRGYWRHTQSRTHAQNRSKLLSLPSWTSMSMSMTIPIPMLVSFTMTKTRSQNAWPDVLRRGGAMTCYYLTWPSEAATIRVVTCLGLENISRYLPRAPERKSESLPRSNPRSGPAHLRRPAC